MFILPIWDLLSSYTGDSRDFGFLWPIFDGYYEDIKFLADLDFQIQIMTLDDGAINLESTKQKVDAQSSTEAKMVTVDICIS